MYPFGTHTPFLSYSANKRLIMTPFLNKIVIICLDLNKYNFFHHLIVKVLLEIYVLPSFIIVILCIIMFKPRRCIDHLIIDQSLITIV